MASLLLFFKREQGGAVRELKTYYSEKHDRELYEMSNGLTYALADEGRWAIILDV
jgi:glycine betaine/choline ABC-type transport system substrate-binding protein